ncbi:MAG: C10 family peptidase [Prevotella sp.]|nr:C10 family peptidase [Prevotella sp.]
MVARQAIAEVAHQPVVDDVRELRSLSHCSVMGASEGGFAVVSADGRTLLGVSSAQTSEGSNPGFEWWLSAINEALARQSRIGDAHRAFNSGNIRPNPKQFPVSVEPLLKTHWGQTDPYNRKCFYDSLKQERTAVGCVATSMAQVLNYYQTPERGHGQRTVYYPYQDSISGQSITVDFASERFRWDLFEGMENFAKQSFTDEQADAISTLLLHLGVAADMRYGTKDVNGSATTAAAAAEGLRNYLYQPDAQVVYRDNYDDDEWMDMVYSELSTGHPLIYGGQAFSGGHSFILNGYDRNGLVYVNWGWNGDSEGYYNINLLNPGGTSFAERQDMIIGICPTIYLPLAVHVELSEPGTLSQQAAELTFSSQCDVVVSGPMSDADFTALRKLLIDYRVKNLNLSDAQFESLPDQAFYGCTELTRLVLPAGLKHLGDGALGDLRFLQELELEPADDADFVVDGSIIYNKDKTEIISVLSTVSGELVVDASVTSVHPYAFAGCVLLKRIELPATITRLETETFRDCYWLEELKVRSKSVIALSGYNIFEGIDKSVCTLYVPSGLKTTYSRRAQWKDFLSIEEFGTTVKANNVVRRQGEPNPEFGYEISGDPVTGTPELYTDATEDSPVGVYTIYVLPGTITSPDVDYVNGRLIIEENTEGIVEIEREGAPAKDYDLQGRRVGNALRRGVYIRNGQKVLR